MTPSTRTGVLPVDKPEGPTSHDVVDRARRALSMRKIGHTGTLDPFASGLMLLCVGAATRLSAHLTHLPKSYEAEVRLGIATDTLDREGEVVEVRDGAERLTDARIEQALARLRGRLEQVPPIYSAKKIGGVPAHRRVRRGEVVELAPVTVHVEALELISRDGATLRLRIDCSAGTFIRALARDLGRDLGVGAHLTALRRLSVGSFSVSEAVPVSALATVPPEAWITPAEALRRAGIAQLEVPGEAGVELALGRSLPWPDEVPVPDAQPVAAVCGGELLAVGEAVGGRFQPRRVFVGS